MFPRQGTTIFVGLLSPRRELQGVTCFGHGPTGRIRVLIGSPVLCLERGACVYYAPKNAASFLISRALRLIHRSTEIARFFLSPPRRALVIARRIETLWRADR